MIISCVRKWLDHPFFRETNGCMIPYIPKYMEFKILFIKCNQAQATYPCVISMPLPVHVAEIVNLAALYVSDSASIPHPL